MNCDDEWTTDLSAGETWLLLREWADRQAAVESWQRTLREIRALPETRR